jgi:Fe2+ transport system protein B
VVPFCFSLMRSFSPLLSQKRNVGILEKIAQQLLSGSSTTKTSTVERKELEQQYKVQLDVLRQLEDRVRQQLVQQQKQQPQSTTSISKLERDFERVQSVAQACKARVARFQKQLQQRGDDAAMAADKASSSASANVLQQDQQRFQMQLQQDVSLKCRIMCVCLRLHLLLLLFSHALSLLSFQIKQRLHEEIMREREQEIRNINKGMHQVNEIYKDLAHIVGSQQDDVDQIETQMDDARGNAESGLEQIQKANEKYNNAQCIIS